MRWGALWAFLSPTSERTVNAKEWLSAHLCFKECAVGHSPFLSFLKQKAYSRRPTRKKGVSHGSPGQLAISLGE